ncbi:mitochondrial amidoxime-reducing component 1 isoform X1 [Hyalella azteca]|uniref:Mitochondrial amidoxime-reducing component 1 isoform X1 n=1 Tax=Hyalella azteca TaxID=294128 RepID=A0A8B7NPI7_HYAAZ|nr:mitochondrial amidoxime-reducing component 1 isoform X1 [Hyalella azteca]
MVPIVTSSQWKGCLAASAVIIGGYVAWKMLKPDSRNVKLLSARELQKAKWQHVGKVKKVWLYPVTSCAPLDLYAALAAVRAGLEELTSSLRDRSYAVVNDSPKYSVVTGRMCPQMVFIKPSLDENGDLTLSYSGRDPLCITKASRQQGPIKISEIEGRTVEGVDCGDEAAAWLQSVLQRPVRLLHFNEDVNKSTRVPNPPTPVTLPLLQPGDSDSNADLTGYSLLSMASVEQLQGPGKSYAALRFRPNILVDSDDKASCGKLRPHQEDEWRYIKIGEMAIFRNVKPCTRCTFVCVDPDTGKKDPNLEPLKTLQRTRMRKPWSEPLFAIMMSLQTRGVVREEDPVYVLY